MPELRKQPLYASLLVLVLPLLFTGCGGGEDDPPNGGSSEGSTAELVAEGEELYGETCAACHGADLKGTSAGPPFLSPIYAPDHHPDGSFYAAVQSGVQPHHWDFGPMPPQPAVSAEDIAAIVAYVRAEQQEAGITEDPGHP